MESWTPPNSEYPPPKADEPDLHRAARLGDHAEIARLLESGADIEAEFDIGLDPGAMDWLATPLMVAAGSGDGASAETVRLLLKLGANPQHSIEGRTAATFAASDLGWNYKPGGDAARLQLLLDAGCKLADEDSIVNRMLCEAAGSGDLERVRILMDNGADCRGHWDPNEAEKRSQDWAQLIDFSAIADEGIRQAAVSHFEGLRITESSAPCSFEIPLFMASESGNAECVAYLLHHGADITQKDNQRRTALFGAGSKQVMTLLLEKGLSFDDTDEYGWNPLVNAVSDGPDSIAKIRWMIELGADVNATHDRGYTVFMSAVSSMERDVSVMKALIDLGADPLAVSELGYNAFHAAIDVDGSASAEESVRQTFTYLMDLGVDIECRTKSGLTPYMLALDRMCEREAQILLQLGAKKLRPPRRACHLRS